MVQTVNIWTVVKQQLQMTHRCTRHNSCRWQTGAHVTTVTDDTQVHTSQQLQMTHRCTRHNSYRWQTGAHVTTVTDDRQVHTSQQLEMTAITSKQCSPCVTDGWSYRTAPVGWCWCCPPHTLPKSWLQSPADRPEPRHLDRAREGLNKHMINRQRCNFLNIIILQISQEASQA